MKKRLLALCLALATFDGASAFQGKRPKEDPNTRSVQGAVRDESDQLVAGAIVQLKNTKTLQVRSYVTKEDGTYQFQGLSTGVDYELKADFQGATSSTKTLSTFDDRKRAIINLKVEKKR